MTRIAAPKRRGKAAKRPDPTPLRDLLADGRVWTSLGLVVAPDGGGAHFELVEDDGQIADVLVEVELQPSLVGVTCRLGQGDGAGGGLWRVPPIGAEVAVLVPDGEIDHMPIIVAVLSSGSVPDRVGEGRTILVAADVVEITAPRVVLGPDPGDVNPITDGFVHGTGQDAYTGLYLWQLGGASSKVQGNK